MGKRVFIFLSQVLSSPWTDFRIIGKVKEQAIPCGILYFTVIGYEIEWDLALLDVKRGIQMFDKTGVKILGLIDNMSYFKGDDGKKYKIFGNSGVERTAKEFNKEFLGYIPIHQDLRKSADNGNPLTHAEPNHEVSVIFKNIAKKIKDSCL